MWLDNLVHPVWFDE